MESLGSGAAVLDLLFQIGSYRSILFDFGTDVSAWTFEFYLKKNKGDRLKTLSLTLGSGLSFPVYASDQVQAIFSSANTSIEEGQYYYELRRTDIALPLINGFAYFTFDAPQGTVDETTLGLTVDDQTVSLVISNINSISSAAIISALGYTPANASDVDAEFALQSTITSNPQSDDYTLVLSDGYPKSKIVEISKATAVNLTVPPNSSVAFPIGTVMWIRRTGAGALTIVEGVGVTVTASSGVLTDSGLNVIMILRKTGTNAWDLQNGAPGVWQTWTPVFTGFSVDPVGTARYTIIGKTCFAYFIPTSDGTSNSTSFTMTLPVAYAGSVGAVTLQQVMNNGTLAVGRGVNTPASNVLTFSSTVTGSSFTSSGTKGVRLSIIYEIN